jgi:hypothetical protein
MGPIVARRAPIGGGTHALLPRSRMDAPTHTELLFSLTGFG